MGIREETFYEGGPHVGDLIIGILLGLTIIGLPVTVGAIVRAAWLRFRITDRRISVTGGWMGRDRTDLIYPELVNVVKMPRGWGSWGDLVVTLKDGSRLELRAIPRFKEIYDHINAKISPKARNASESVSR